MDDAATKIAAVWRGYRCRNNQLDGVDWRDRLNDYLYRRYYDGLWYMNTLVEPGDCVFHGGKHALTYRDLPTEAMDARERWVLTDSDTDSDSDITSAEEDFLEKMIVCDWCAKCITDDYSYHCIMGCDFDLCSVCYNYERYGRLKNFTEFGEREEDRRSSSSLYNFPLLDSMGFVIDQSN